MQEAKALAKSFLENRESGKHLYFHQAYLTCLYKASLHEHLHKEVRDKEWQSVVRLWGCVDEYVKKYSHKSKWETDKLHSLLFLKSWTMMSVVDCINQPFIIYITIKTQLIISDAILK